TANIPGRSPDKGKQPNHWPDFTPARQPQLAPLRGLLSHRPTHVGAVIAVIFFRSAFRVLSEAWPQYRAASTTAAE
ncbi:hypothetical protein, partial [Jiella pacifica]|uniref:hypothetical protein n=1 Tax=Jiella pacifica TaxID=2696469 RepID=UPI0019403997